MNTPAVERNQALASLEDRQEPGEKPAAQRKLSRTHYTILAQMAANPDNPLRKLSGGFWVVDPNADEYQEGQWHASTQDVSRMLKQGFVVEVNSRSVKLTSVGVEALRTEKYTPLK